MIFTSTINSSRGFSLIEVMVAAGLLSGLAIYGMKIMQTQTQSSSHLSAKMDEIELRRILTLNLQDKFACSNTFNGVKIGEKLPAIKNAINGNAYTVGTVYGEGKTKITSLSTEYLNPASGKMHDVDLVVGVEKNVMGKKTPTQFRIRMKVEAENPKEVITSCYSETLDLEEICLSFKGIWNNGDLSCKLPIKPVSCGPDQAIQSISQDGVATCISIKKTLPDVPPVDDPEPPKEECPATVVTVGGKECSLPKASSGAAVYCSGNPTPEPCVPNKFGTWYCAYQVQDYSTKEICSKECRNHGLTEKKVCKDGSWQ